MDIANIYTMTRQNVVGSLYSAAVNPPVRWVLPDPNQVVDLLLALRGDNLRLCYRNCALTRNHRSANRRYLIMENVTGFVLLSINQCIP